MASNINMIETENIEMSERIGHSFLQRQTQQSLRRAAATKGHLISECKFGVFKSPKKSFTYFCLSFIGQKSVKDFLGDLKTPKFHSEIN